MVPPRFCSAPGAHVLGTWVPVAVTWRQRLLGLAFLTRRRAGAGLWIPRCRSVHSFGMRFDLEVVFVDRDGRPLRRIERLRPNRVVACARAHGVLERPAEPGGGGAGTDAGV